MLRATSGGREFFSADRLKNRQAQGLDHAVELASRLSENPDVDILVIESGPDDTSPFIAMPLGAGRLMGIGGTGHRDPRTDHFFHYSIAPGSGGG